MKLRVNLSIGLVARQEDEIEIADADLEGLTDQQRENWINDEVREWALNLTEWNWEEIE